MVYIFICVNNIFSEFIQRTAKEHKIVYKLMKLIPDINVHLSDAELKGLSMHTIKKYQEKGSTGSSIAITETLSSGYKIRICWFCRCWSSYIVSLLCMMSFVRVTLLRKIKVLFSFHKQNRRCYQRQISYSLRGKIGSSYIRILERNVFAV